MFQRALAMTTDEDSLYTQQKTQLVVMETRMEDLQRQIKKLGETVTERDATIVEKEEKEREMYITVRRAESKVKKAVEARDKAFKEAAVRESWPPTLSRPPTPPWRPTLSSSSLPSLVPTRLWPTTTRSRVSKSRTTEEPRLIHVSLEREAARYEGGAVRSVRRRVLSVLHVV